MSSLYRRGGVWWLETCESGHRYRKSTRIRIRDDPKGVLARQVQRDADTARARCAAGVEDERLPLRLALDNWLRTITHAGAKFQQDTRTRLEKLVRWLEDRGIETLEQIRPEDLGDWIQMRSYDVSRKTIALELQQLRAVAVLANRTRTVSPIRLDSWPQVQRAQTKHPDRLGAYSRDEVERLLAYFRASEDAHRWYLPVLLLSHLGCRWGELQAARVGDVRLDEDPPSIRIESRKTARAAQSQYRWVELHPRIIPDMQRLTAGRDPGDPLVDMPLNADVQGVLGLACRKLGIQYRRAHGLRHYWITSLLSAGVPLAVVMRMAGHRSLATTQRYLHLGDRHTGWVTKAL